MSAEGTQLAEVANLAAGTAILNLPKDAEIHTVKAEANGATGGYNATIGFIWHESDFNLYVQVRPGVGREWQIRRAG